MDIWLILLWVGFALLIINMPDIIAYNPEEDPMPETLISQFRQSKITYEQYRIRKAVEMKRHMAADLSEMTKAYEEHLDQLDNAKHPGEDVSND